MSDRPSINDIAIALSLVRDTVEKRQSTTMVLEAVQDYTRLMMIAARQPLIDSIFKVLVELGKAGGNQLHGVNVPPMPHDKVRELWVMLQEAYTDAQ